MDKITWICLSLPALLVLLHPGTLGVSTDDVSTYHTCREDNVTFTWTANMTHIYFVDMIFEPHDQEASNATNARTTILSIIKDTTGEKPDRVSTITKYVGRLSYVFQDEKFSVKIMGVSPKDRGFYELHVVGKPHNFEGKGDLIVYAEDNLWPKEDEETVAALELMKSTEPEAATGNHIYPFKKHPQSPVIGMTMSVIAHPEIELRYCYFENTSRCQIEFEREALAGLTGTVRFDVIPQLEDDAITCPTVSTPYAYQITMVPHSLSSALVGGICVSVFIAVAVVVITPIIIYMKNKQDKYLPMKGGYDFLKGCIQRIEETPDISDVYRKSANSKMIHPHIQGYFTDPKAREVFFLDEGLTKIYFAAFIKHYIMNVREPLIPLEYVKKIKSGDFERDDNFNISRVKSQFAIKKGDNRKTKYRKRMLRLLFQHFSWFRDRKIEADGSDSEESSPTKILTTSGLTGILAMNFDRTSLAANMEEFDRIACLVRFLKKTIEHCDEIFGSREDINGSAVTDISINITSEPLLEESQA